MISCFAQAENLNVERVEMEDGSFNYEAKDKDSDEVLFIVNCKNDNYNLIHDTCRVLDLDTLKPKE